ncbi:MAG: hypothetical protein WBC70_15145 [Candidatus Aminicenantales bacterium]
MYRRDQEHPRSAGRLIGILHGVGEVLQGNVAPEGIIIESWTRGPLAEHMGGDPGMTIVPNLLVTGILTLIFSLAVIVWSAAFLERKRGGLVLLLLSVGMLLVGGGFGPPTLAILAGVGGLGIHARHTWWRKHVPGGARRFLAKLWPWIFGVCAVNGIFLVIGHVIPVFFLGVRNAALFTGSFFVAVVTLLLSILTGIAYDIERKNRRGAAAPLRVRPTKHSGANPTF